MAKFHNPQELESYIRQFGKVTAAHRAVLADPNGGLSEVPADQIQHYIDKGFAWPAPPAPVPEPPEPTPAPEPSEGNVPDSPPPGGRRGWGQTSSRAGPVTTGSLRGRRQKPGA